MAAKSTLDTVRFPPAPVGLKGRETELATLGRAIVEAHPCRLALVGGGGSGKSMLAAALGHALAADFSGRVHWFRVGAWDFYTLTEVLALGLGTPSGDGRVEALQRFFAEGGPRLVFLDNHEDDRAMARLLDTFAQSPVTFVITARRCLLSGVLVFPVTAPLVTAGGAAFPRVQALTRLLRYGPLALDLADSIVAAGDATVAELASFLRDGGVERVAAVEHEDDLPEVALLVDWAFQRLPAASRRMLAVLCHSEGDHVDGASLGRLAHAGRKAEAAIRALLRWHLIQEPAAGRYAVHAVVRHALRRRTSFEPRAFFDYYVDLLERHPERLALEHSHLFAAMDQAHRSGELDDALRIQRLLVQLRDDID